MSNQLSHLFIKKEPEVREFTSMPSGGGDDHKEFKEPSSHGRKIKKDFKKALASKSHEYIENFGIYLTFTGDEDLLERASSLEYSDQITISNIRHDKVNKTVYVTIFVNKAHINRLLKKLTEYLEDQKTKNGEGVTKNRPLMNSIDSIKASILKELWVGDESLIPQETVKKWCEIWVIGRNINDFIECCDKLKINYNKKRILKFLDRSVILIEVNKIDLNNLLESYSLIGEFRPINEVAKYWAEMPNIKQADWVDNLQKRTKINKNTKTAICVLDTGVNNGHPLLENIIDDKECDSIEKTWGNNDTEKLGGHGTGMCGLVAYGDIQSSLESSNGIEINHSISSIKILPNRDYVGEPTSYGSVTEDGVSRAEIIHPQKDIICCMAITENKPSNFNLEGNPSSWSATIDKVISGQDIDNLQTPGDKRLFLISAGNVNYMQMNYPETNMNEPVESPGQAWNAITVGAYTQKDEIKTHKPLAKKDSLSPYSRTSLAWYNSQWPIKPEVLFEGGNKAKDESGTYFCEECAVLSLNNNITANFFSTMSGTSPATAKAAYFAALIKEKYPNLKPETVRALMVHSAEWTDEMKSRFLNDTGRKSDYAKILRTCGYGVPDLEKALYSASNSLVLIAENEIQPYQKKLGADNASTKEMHIYELPWPKDELLKLGELDVKLKVTLSYFIEPAPLGCGTNSKYRYSSYGLRFDINRAGEKKETMIRKINKNDNEEAKVNGIEIESRPKDVPWRYGDECNVNNGSIHSNIWEGTAAELALSNNLIVYPVMGWWKDRKQFACYNKKAHYSLVVSLYTPEITTDIYTPVANMIKVSTKVPVQ